MNSIGIITRREFSTQVRKKSFIIMTLVSPILVILASILTVYLTKVNHGTTRIGVIDESAKFYKNFKSDRSVSYNFYDISELNDIKDSVSNGNLKALVYIPKIDNSTYNNIENQTEIFINKNLNKRIYSSIKSSISKEIEDSRKAYLGISHNDYDKIKANVNLKIISLLDGNTEGNSIIKEILSLSLAYIIMMFILIYGTRIMRNITEEKNNRVVEIIISSVKPYELMIGKILGTTLVALSQFAIWIIMVLIVLFIGKIYSSSEIIQFQNIININEFIESSNNDEVKEIIKSLFSLNFGFIIFVFLFYFFVGYLFYSSFFSAIGAAVDNDTETQQFMPIIAISLMIGLYGSLNVMNNPDGDVGFWFSMIPFTSPLVMVSRSIYGVPLWELILSMSIMIISVVIMIIIASKIYRIGILMYGKKITFKELLKWLRQS